jgi:quercetin dioxygenase-like cupin family protein
MKMQVIEQVPAKPVTMEGAKDTRMRMLIGPDDGAPNFHMRCFEIAPGGHTPHHQHDYEHEILILQGEGIARSESGEVPFKPGTAIYVPPNEKHQFVNNSSQPCRFICLIPAPRDCTAGR